MKLTRRTLLYSLALTIITALFILFYLLFLMPSLYLDNMKINNLNTSKEFMRKVLEDPTLKSVESPSKFSTFLITIPERGNTFNFWNGVNSFDALIENPETIKFLNLIKDIDKMGNIEEGVTLEGAFNDNFNEFLANIINIFHKNGILITNLKTNEGDQYLNENARTSFYKGEGYTIIENSVMEKQNLYTTYFAFGKKNGNTYLALIPFSLSKIDNIKNISLGSLPMILVFLSLISLIFAYFYSQKIVDPIVRLSKHTRDIKRANLMEVDAFYHGPNDEIKELGEDIDSMYENLRATMAKLKDEMDNKELFLKAGSHQLKTPVAASILLIEGMQANIGKYKDRDRYLPEVKKQLINMQKIIDDLLFISRTKKALDLKDVNIKDMVLGILNEEKLSLMNKEMTYRLSLSKKAINTDEGILEKILATLISNCLIHGSKGSEIIINDTVDGIEIINTNAHIDETIIKEIFQPFVTSRKSNKTAGLGLYIAKRFSEELGLELTLKNDGNNVVARLKGL